MKHKRPVSQRINLILIVLLTAACTTAQPEIAPAPPTNTPAPPTATTAPPTATTVSTATPIPTATATITPTEVPALNPSARGYVSMAYDSESDKIILFGGQLAGGMQGSDETWAYDVASNTWTEMKPTSGPPEKGAIDLVYDTESDRVILFGGNWGDSDTWAYDYNTNTWTEMVAKGPGDHLGYRMAYDAESDRCILFGGANFTGYPDFYNDTWAYDFNSDTWTEMEPDKMPYARNYHAMAYDAQVDRIIMFGGGHVQDDMGDTWVYDFNSDTWTKLEPSGGIRPSSRSYHAMIYDPVSNKTILFGGNVDGHETWSFETSTSTWTLLDPDQTPGRRSRHAMAYSTAAGLTILFGGQPGEVNLDFTDQTWSFDLNNSTWTNLTRSP